MFDSFLSHFHPDIDIAGRPGALPPSLPEIHGFPQLFNSFSGMSFNAGLYRVHDVAALEYWNDAIWQAFPDFRGRAICFGFDWGGTQFAVDLKRVEDGDPLVLMFEVDTGEALEIPFRFSVFHDVGLVTMGDAILATDLYNRWRKSHKDVRLGHDMCVGYKVPLFLGGKDSVKNLEVTDLEVYWSVGSQLLDQVRGLPPGTVISGVKGT